MADTRAPRKKRMSDPSHSPDSTATLSSTPARKRPRTAADTDSSILNFGKEKPDALPGRYQAAKLMGINSAERLAMGGRSNGVMAGVQLGTGKGPVGGAGRTASGSGGGGKKLKITGFSRKPALPPNFEADTWARLEAAVAAIHKAAPVGVSLESLYRDVENMCSHKLGPSLYTKLVRVTEEHIKTLARQLVGQTPDPVAYLDLINAVWSEHCQQMMMVRSIFLYLDRTYVMSMPSLPSLWDMGLALYRKHVYSIPEVTKKSLKGLLMLIERERRGEAVNSMTLKSILTSYSALGIYASAFEGAFLTETNQFYTSEAQNSLEELEVADYLRLVESRLREENRRVGAYLDPATGRPLIAAVESHTLGAQIDRILSKGFVKLMDQGQVADLARLYNLLGRVGGHGQLKDGYVDYIKVRGADLVSDPAKDSAMVADLLEYKKKLDRVLHSAFADNDAFVYGTKEAFESFINKRENAPAEMVAKFIDTTLKRGNKSGSEEDLEARLDSVLTLFRFIQGKDVFEAFYKNQLAKRLLLGKSASFDMEKLMIQKLKTECGASFTNKLEGMFTDMDLSNDIMLSFRQSAAMQGQLRAIGPLDMSVHVLTQAYWPPYPPMEIKLPKDMADYQDVFKSFYLSKHTGRRLTWQHSLSNTVVKARFPVGQKELAVSFFQTLILLLFNAAGALNPDSPLKIPYADIAAATGIEPTELKRNLQSLACGKVRVLVKHPKGRDVNESDSFSVNLKFSAKLYRIRINSIQLKETKEENTKTNEAVFQDRQFAVDAAIVRIMKTRKTIKHPVLMSEILKQCKFPVKVTDIKKRIESLIDRDYLERDEEDSTTYHYVA